MAAFEGQLEHLKSAQPAAPEADCPEPAVWRAIAVALIAPDQALVHLQHASRCDHCGPLLREAVTEMNSQITEAEAKQIAALDSARPEWQQTLATRITGAPATAAPLPWWKVWCSAPRLALIGVSLAVIVAGGMWLAVKEARPAPPADLLASAYSEQRPFELRIAGAAYAPVRVQRGAESSFLGRPEALLKAEARIAAEIGSHPSDPNWLQAKARADLLDGKYDSAVETLRHALQIAPKTPGFLIDLGTAYFQRAQGADRPEDLGAAYETLSQALAAEPDNSVALFNRAIVAEHQFLFHQALDDWDHYLRVDTGSDWTPEARQHADAVRAKLKQHDQSHAAPLLTPAQIAGQLGNIEIRSGAPGNGVLGTPEFRAQVNQRIEEYLHQAVRSWLPQAYPEGNRVPDPSAVQALFFLADLTAQQHGDRWLSDLLSGSSVPIFPQAVSALAAAVKASDASDYDNSSKQAGASARFFRISGNTAGALYAEFEQAFSAQLLRHIDSCRSQSAAAEAESEKYPYWWLQVQLGLEQAVCSGIMGNLGADEKISRQAMERAQRAGYGGVFLRALGFVVQDRSQMGDLAVAWKSLNEGLSRYWSGQIPTVRGNNLYGAGADVAESAGRPNLQLAAWREGLNLISSDGDILLLAGAHGEVARAATAAGMPAFAEQSYSEAARLYGMAPQTGAVLTAKIHNQLWAAEVESRLGQREKAMARLTAIGAELSSLHENYLVQMYHATLGGLLLSQGRYTEAEESLRAAMALAEQNLSSLRSQEEQLRWSKAAESIYLGLAETAIAQGRPEESLDAFEWYLGAAERAGHRSTTGLPDRSVLSSRLPLLFDSMVIAYGLLPDGLAIWTYDNRGVNAKWIPGKNDEILDVADRLHGLASDPNSDSTALRRDGRELYALLIAPIERELEPERTLLIETDESLAGVPYEALLDSSDHYLLERAPIVHSIGMYVDGKLRASAPISEQTTALIVDSSAAPQSAGLTPLPDLGAETEAVARSFRNATLLQPGQATLDAVSAALKTAAIFHFAGHSFVGPGRAGLLLQGRNSEDWSLLGADSLSHVKTRRLQLAVLSACSTANAGSGDTSGFSSLAEGFLRSGVPHVVASRWAVDSVQTRNFVEDFYRNLLSGVSVSEATRLTARKMLANPQTAHPYYWSAFAAYGRP